MPYDKGDDWARKLKIKTTGMFSTPSYFGVGEPYEDGYTSERPTAQPNIAPAPGKLTTALLHAQARGRARRGCR